MFASRNHIMQLIFSQYIFFRNDTNNFFRIIENSNRKLTKTHKKSLQRRLSYKTNSLLLMP